MKKIVQRVSAWIAALPLVLMSLDAAHAAELHILGGGALAEPLKDLVTQFEKTSGHKLIFRYGTTPQLIQMIKSGVAFDLGVFPQDVLQDNAVRVKFAARPATNIAHVGLAVAVRTGAAKPDISTPDALKRTLLNAESIATIPASATGTQLLQVFNVLGISEAMKPKTMAQETPAQIVQTVASGKAQLAVFVMNVVMAPGLDVVGPFPKELQREVVFTAAIAANSKQAKAAQAFINFLRSPSAITVLKAKGLNPG